MEKRTLLAVVLTMIVWVAWFWFFVPDPKLSDKPVPVVQEKQEEKTVTREEVQKERPVRAGTYASLSRNIKEQVIDLKTEKFRFELTNRGASISQMVNLILPFILTKRSFSRVMSWRKLYGISEGEMTIQ
jgi:YidC/Oxa1 family membrane protein insertase